MTFKVRDSLLLCSLHTSDFSVFHCSIIHLPMPMKWLYSKRIWIQSLVGMKVLFSYHIQDGTRGLHISSCPVGTDSFCPRVKQLRHDLNHSPSKVLNFKNEWSCTSIRRPSFMLHCTCILILVPLYEVSGQKVSHSSFRIRKQIKQ